MKERTAQCGCGNIKITVKGEPEACWVCHCDYCQRITASLGTMAAVFPDDQIVSIEGEASVFDDFPKWPGTERYFCGKCSSAVHWINPTAFPNKRLIAIGSFSDKDFPGPTASFHTKYRHNWMQSFIGAEDFASTRKSTEADDV